MNRITQRKLVLSYLKENRDRFVPVYEVIGEKHLEEYGWRLFSHRAPARLTELFQDGLIERKRVKGKTGAYYYSYKFKSREPEQVSLI